MKLNSTPLISVVIACSMAAQEISTPSQEPPQGETKPLSKKEKKEAERRNRAEQKAAQRAAEAAAMHLTLPMGDISTSCVTLGSMALHRDVDREYQDVWKLNYIDHVGFSVLGTARNRCGGEAEISVQARFYDRFGAEVSVAFVNAIVAPHGSIPVRVVPSTCSSGLQVGGEEICAILIDTVRVRMNSTL